MVEKSSPQWVTVGQTISLTCKTNQPWNMCRWILPSEETCDKRKDELYDVACIHNSRVRFQKSKWHQVGNGRLISKQQINQLKNECTIEVREATLADHGTWTCLATEILLVGLKTMCKLPLKCLWHLHMNCKCCPDPMKL